MNASPAGVLHFKLPTFSTVDAAIGFCRAEVQFCLRKVRFSHIQADHVLAAIPDTIFPQMSTWLNAKGDDAIEYQDLKAFLLQKFSPSAEQRVQMILDRSNQPLRDQRPSDTLTEMRSLCRLPPDDTGTSAKIDVLLALWLRRLPTPVRSAITNFASYDDDDLAKRADSLLDAQAAANPPSLTAATSTGPPDEDDPSYDAVASPAQHFNASKRHFNRPAAQTHHPRSQQNTSFTPSSFRKSSSTSRSCYYHERFGPTAKKCQHPCIWSKNALQRWPPYPLMLSFCLIPIQVFSSSLTLVPADPSFRSPRYTAAALLAPTQTSLLPTVHIS